MTSNRKTRKFEGTCYIPGEQLAIMAKYYRGANLNLNLTLVEDDMAIMNESLENSCWCSKLDEVDRMKLQHMKGNAWKIEHDHHQKRSALGGRGSENCCFAPVKFSGMEGRPEARVDKGTDTVSLYNQSHRRDYYDTSPNAYPKRDNSYNGDRRSGRKESPRRGFLHSQDVEFQRPHNTYAYPVRYSPRHDNDDRHRRNENHEMEDEMSSLWTFEKSDNDIKCVVCNKDVCAVCKNPLRGRPCHCKCAIPNAGLCNECDMQCEKESEKEGSVSRGHEQTQTNWSNLMLLMMSSQMLNRPQNNESHCKCSLKNSKPVSVCDSGSASGSSSCSCCTEKVKKIYVYDCESPEKLKKKKARNSNKNKMRNSSSTEGSTDSSKDCDCCKCSKKDTKHNKAPSFQGKRELETSAINEPMKNAKSSVAPDKEHVSVAGKIAGDKHSSFRQPLDDNQPDASRKKKTNKKRRKVEDSTDNDTKSLSSRRSDSISDRKQSSQSLPVDLKDFLVFLPKIKLDLEQLLTRLEQVDRKSYNHGEVSHRPVPMSQQHFTNFRMRSNVPFITHPASYAPLSTRPLSQGTCPPSKLHPNLDYSIFQNHNIPSDSLGKLNMVDHRIPNQNYNDTVHPRRENWSFPSLSSNKVGSTMSYENGLGDHILSNVHSSNIRQNGGGSYAFGTMHKQSVPETKAILREFQTPKDLWKRNQINHPLCSIGETFNLTNLDTSTDQTDLQNYNNKSARNSLDHGLSVNHQSLFPRKPSIEVMKDSKITNSKTDETNKGAANFFEDCQRVNVERNSQHDKKVEGPSNNGIYNDFVSSNDFITFRAKPLNAPMQSVQSYDSKHTSDQFISAVEGNEHFSEDASTLESEHKPIFAIPGQQASDKFTGNKTTQSIGPGQFRVSTFNSLDFKSPHGPFRKNHRSHTSFKRKRYLYDEGASEVSPKEEDQIDSHRVEVENRSLAFTHPTSCIQDIVKPRGQSLDVNVSDEKASRNFTSHEDRLKFTIKPHDSVIALSETLIKSSDSYSVVLSNMEVRNIKPALKEDAEFYSTIDKIEYTSAVEDVSRDSFQCGIAHSSLPSSEEDVNLPHLPAEFIERMCFQKGKECCSREEQHKESNHSEKFIGNDIAGGTGILHMKNMQVAKFKLANEEILSMVQNVNEVLASIDSDSETKITATPSRHRGRVRQSFFTHLKRDETVNERHQEGAISKYQSDPLIMETDSCRFNPRQFDTYRQAEPPESLQSFCRTELRSRESSSLTPSSQGGGEFKIQSRERNYFVLDSDDSNSSAFTEKLRQSLANEISSPNLSAVLTPEEYIGNGSSKRTSSPKPLKRRSWIPQSK